MARIDINTRPKAGGISRSSICCNDVHVVLPKADCLVGNGAAVDDAEAICFALCDIEGCMCASRVALSRPRPLHRPPCMNNCCVSISVPVHAKVHADIVLTTADFLAGDGSAIDDTKATCSVFCDIEGCMCASRLAQSRPRLLHSPTCINTSCIRM